ncbi:unnamed protein product [Allacma fusca]|uniref:Uncharacterized protein n=1 Tax=Allacma fusca TaxID=39272 RepID=A0A8J2L440_9HEXA|nr:unnamed protein product [Allacma fusca]
MAFAYLQKDETISNFILPGHQRQVRDGDAYQLVQDHCKIPNVPVHSKILKKFTDKGLDPKLNKCSGDADFTLLKNNILHLTDNSLESRCCVHKIFRPVLLPTDDFM